jgi:ABC-type phosphonate transport system ATPase subunit
MIRKAFSAVGLCVALLLAMPAHAADEFAVDKAAADELAAYVDVVGAPGDGKEALERALSNRLLDRGFTVTSTPAVNAYEIQGIVRLSPADRGKENIRIDWIVFGPDGTRISNVTQTNVIRKGSLDRRWGPAADAAANAAAQDIFRLLPQ